MFRVAKRLLIRAWERTKELNDHNVVSLMERDSKALLLDLGCGGGEFTSKIAAKVGTREVYGIEIDDVAIESLKEKEINVKRVDLNEGIPFPEGFFDVVNANQIIEHIDKVDQFVREINRILKPCGYAVISTENLSAIDNLMALFFGQQAFSQHISQEFFIGNIFSPHYHGRIERPSWAHRTVFTYFGLQQLFEFYGFKVEKILTAGFLPLPSFFSRLDPIHSHFIAIKVRKVEQASHSSRDKQ